MNMSSYNCCKSSSPDFTRIKNLSSLLALVGEESRLKLLCILHKGEHCVCQLMEHLPFTQSLVSHHLKDLKDAGILSDRKEGKWVYYSLTDKGKSITNKIFSLSVEGETNEK